MTEEITAEGFSNLNWSADGTTQVYFHLVLSVSTSQYLLLDFVNSFFDLSSGILAIFMYSLSSFFEQKLHFLAITRWLC